MTSLLLAFAGRQLLRPRPVELRSELTRLKPSLARVLRPTQRLVLDAPEQELAIMLDPQALGACLSQLVENAARASPADAVIRLSLEVRHDVPGHPAGGAEIAVTDPGTGMSEAELRRFRAPFVSGGQRGGPDDVTPEPARLHIGPRLGMGLPAAEGFARQSGGRLRIDTAPGRGTRVSLLLPLGEINEQPLAPPKVQPPRRQLPQKARILVVDDNASVRTSLVRRLEAQGYEVLSAGSTDQARLHLARGVDALVTDVVLGGAEDGVALALFARAGDPALALMFISGFMSMRQPELLAGDELASFVRKPINTHELLVVLDGLLALRAMRLGG